MRKYFQRNSLIFVARLPFVLFILPNCTYRKVTAANDLSSYCMKLVYVATVVGTRRSGFTTRRLKLPAIQLVRQVIDSQQSKCVSKMYFTAGEEHAKPDGSVLRAPHECGRHVVTSIDLMSSPIPNSRVAAELATSKINAYYSG